MIDMTWSVAPAGVSRSGSCVLPAYAGAALRPSLGAPSLVGTAAPIDGTGLPIAGGFTATRVRPVTQAPLAGRIETGTPAINVQKNDSTLGNHSSGRPQS